MFYFYSIYHGPSRRTFLGITHKDPYKIIWHRGYPKYWVDHLRKYKSKKLKITILHQSPDITVIKRWKKHYFTTWDVYNNKKFAHAHMPKRPKTQRNPNIGTYISLYKMKWYTNGYNNLFITEGTQPDGYRRGRTTPRNALKHKRSDKTRAQMAKSHRRPVISPSGKRYKSLQEAAKAYGICYTTICKYLKNGINGWRYA